MSSDFESKDSKRQRGRPATLSREIILEAASAIPMKEFSIRTVAERLKVSPSSIYYYYKNGKALLAALAEEDLARAPKTSDADWRTYFRQCMLSYRSLLIASDSAALLPEINGSWVRLNNETSEALLTQMEEFVGVLMKAGFSPQEAIEVWNLGTTLVVRSLVTRLTDQGVQDHWSELRSDVESLGADRFPTLRVVLSEDPTTTVDDWFGRIVEVAVEGVAAVYGVA